MQETGLFVYVSIGLAVVCIYCAWYVAGGVQRIAEAARKVQAIQDDQTNVHDRLDVLHTALKRTEGRIVKSQARAKPEDDVSTPPDPRVNPEGWKRWQNRAISTARSKLQ